MKVALVYDRVNKWGGAERLLLALHKIWPKAPLFTAVYSPSTAPWANKFEVIPSFLQSFLLVKRHHEFFPWLMPLAFESFNFDDYDVVISVTSEAAKGVITRPGTFHCCYCLTPTRYLWSGYHQYFPSPATCLSSWPAVTYLRHWDKIAAQRPDGFLAISQNVQERIKQFYGRDSAVVYPPVDTEKFKPAIASLKPEPYFLVVSRLVSYKRIEIAVKAFNQMGLSLKIVGVGNQLSKLKAIARKNIEFLGQLTNDQLLSYYRRCQAVIFPPEEDFGLVPLEAQACGRPVIAYRKGGARETVVEGKTGLLFFPQTPEALVKAVEKFRSSQFSPKVCRQNALKFSQKKFKKEFKKTIKKLTAK